MSSGKMSPRQKMINMMYLVLTALLALNVSKEILIPFHLFEQSFNNAAKNIDSKNTATLSALQKQMDALKPRPRVTESIMGAMKGNVEGKRLAPFGRQ